MIERVVLIGLSGAGKSTTGRLIASRLGWTFIDLDEAIEFDSGRSVPEIFQLDGEPRFRELESKIFRRALSESQVVIATGGGAVINPEVWDPGWLGERDTLTVWLDARTEHLVDRLLDQASREGDRVKRPLLDGDPVAKIEKMREQRRASYGRASVAFDVSHRAPDSVASDIADFVTLASGQPMTIDLDVESAQSHIRIGPDVSLALVDTIRSGWPNAQQVFVVCDASVLPFVADRLATLEETLSLPVRIHRVPAGETSKSTSQLIELWDWMLGEGIERGDAVVAIGGGMVGDLAGFAAATVLRGVGLIHVPTTLLSMVDSSVGGKTAINHPAGKNLIGAFHQARSVLIDSSLLDSLPEREYRSGWAEIIKHAVIEASTPGGQPPRLFGVLERNSDALMSRQEPLLSTVIGCNVAIKAAVVAADEREAGIRAFLNFGHTIGHGIEAAGYSLLHGEAVAVGISAALEIAMAKDLIDEAYARRVRDLIRAFGLPLVADVDPDEVLRMMSSDKKKLRGKQTWVLPVLDIGVELRNDVPEDLVRHAIRSVTGLP